MISRIALMLMTSISICMLSMSCAQAAAFRSGAFRQISPEETDAIVAALSRETDPYAHRTYPISTKVEKKPTRPTHYRLLSPARTSPHEPQSPLCLCPDFTKSMLPPDEDAAFQQALSAHPSKTPAEQIAIFKRLSSEADPINWVRLFEKTEPDKKKNLQEAADPAYALVDILSPPYIGDRNVWPALQSLAALCLHALPDKTIPHATEIQGRGPKETVFTIGAARDAIHLVAYALALRTQYDSSGFMIYNSRSLYPPACATTKTMLQLFECHSTDFSWQRPETSETLLHLSMQSDRCPCTTHYLLNLCAQGTINIDATTLYSETALHTLAHESKYYNKSKKDELLRKTKLICESGINISARNYKGETAVEILENYQRYWMEKVRNGHFLNTDEERSLIFTEEVLKILRVAAGRHRSSDGYRRSGTPSYSPRSMVRPPTSPIGGSSLKPNSPSASHGGLRAS